MEKLQRRLRMFIVLAILSGVAAVVYVAAVKPAKAAEAELTPPPITAQDLGLNQPPPTEGLGAWWDNFKDQVKLQLTFDDQKKAELQLQRMSKLIWRTQQAGQTKAVDSLLIKYRRQLNKVTEALRQNNEPNWLEFKNRFTAILLNHQALLAELAEQTEGNSIAATRQAAWDQLTSALGNLSDDDFKALLNKINLPDNAHKLRGALLLEEWRAALPADKQALLTATTQNIIDQFKSLSTIEAGDLAELLSRLPANLNNKTAIAKLLERSQPNLQGLTKQLQPPATNQPALVPLFNPSNTLKVNLAPLSAAELTQRQRELTDATTKDELLALRQKWYNNQLLYLQLTTYHSALLNQLNSKLQTALGKNPRPAAAPQTSSNEQPLPTQQLTPEQQAAAGQYLQQFQQQYPDLPPPNTGQ